MLTVVFVYSLDVLMQVLVGMEAKVLGQGLAQGLGLEVVLGLELANKRALSTTRVVGRLMTGVPCRRSRTSSPLEAMLASTPSSKLHTACSSFGGQFWMAISATQLMDVSDCFYTYIS